MRKVLLALALITIKLTASAQAIIPFVGGNLSWYRVKGGTQSSKPVAGFNAGVLVDLPASPVFFLQTGLQYALTGGKIVTRDAYNALPPLEDLYRVYTLQVPVLLVLKIGEEDRQHFFVGAGFYVTANIAGTLDIKSSSFDLYHNTITAYHRTEKLQITANGNFSQFDFGLNTGAGYRFGNGIELYGFFQKGYMDLKGDYYTSNVRTFQAGLCVRYALKLQKKRATK